MRHAILMLAAVLVMGGVRHAQAHELRPGYLEVRQTGPETFAVLWKVPARDDLRLGLYLQLPDNCTPVSEPLRLQTRTPTPSAPPGLRGRTGGAAHCRRRPHGNAHRCARAAGTGRRVDTERAPGAICPSFVVAAVPSRFQAAATYLRLGVEHILMGVDHLLFVLGLLLIVPEPLDAAQDHHLVHGRA